MKLEFWQNGIPQCVESDQILVYDSADNIIAVVWKFAEGSIFVTRIGDEDHDFVLERLGIDKIEIQHFPLKE